MNLPIIYMVHEMEGRLRVKISHPISDINEAENFIKEVEGVTSFKYNDKIKSILVNYDSNIAYVEDIIIKIALLMKKLYGFHKVKFISNCKKNDMPLFSYYSLASICCSKLMKIIGINARGQEFLNWITIGTTIGAITQHAYMEINEKGTIDPEVMSIMYLINSIGKGNMTEASLVTWITTFGRHILKKSNETFILKVEKSKMRCQDKPCYDISILSEEINNNNKLDSFRLFASEIIESQNRLNPNFGYRGGGGSVKNEGMFFNLK